MLLLEHFEYYCAFDVPRDGKPIAVVSKYNRTTGVTTVTQCGCPSEVRVPMGAQLLIGSFRPVYHKTLMNLLIDEVRS